MSDDTEGQAALIALVGRHAATAALQTDTMLPGVSLFRRSHPSPPYTYVCKPSLYLVAQGCKLARLGEQCLRYDPDCYVLTSVPLPMETQVVEASPEHPYLAVGIELSLDTVRTVMQRGWEAFRALPPPQPQQGLGLSPVEPALRAAVVRLLRLLDQPGDVPVLAPLCIQEIIWRVLVGSQGDFLRALALGHGRAHAISGLLVEIQQDCTQDWRVGELAAQVGMSETVFYEVFKTITGRSPLQYIKHLRLLEAHRHLKLGRGVSEVAYQVGYSSPSQFSREFRRVFGAPPSAVHTAAATIGS